MPKEMFFKIKEEKRNRFIKAAIDEFTSKPFDSVSVNTIVKKAKISRGSFYTYFDDLDALFNYIFKGVKEERIKQANSLIKESNGDYFKFIKGLFEKDYDAYSKQGTYSLFKNYIYYLQSSKKVSIKDSILIETIATFIEQNNELNIFDHNNLHLDKKEFLDLIEVIVILMVNTYMKSETENLTKAETISLFNKRISFLEYGVKNN